ncbi:MAG: ChaN family lipoprotein, partial [Pseudobdellovibrionaceae bacterium]
MAEQSWIRIRKHLAEKIEHLVNEKLGGKNPQLIRYENEYFETLNRKWKIEDRRALLDRLMAVRLVYLGDFHALRQSQKAHLRILRSVLGKKEIVIGLECFASKDQKWIDLHLGGKLSEESLLKKTKWDQNWGFPWENYRVVMQFAKQHRLPVYGLNSPVESVQSLQKRDRHAAQVILKMRKQHPRATLFVVFGDLHLADAHLPKKVTKVAKSKRENFVRIFQNSEKLYYRLA